MGTGGMEDGAVRGRIPPWDTNLKINRLRQLLWLRHMDHFSLLY